MAALVHFSFGKVVIRLLQRYLVVRGFLHDEIVEQQALNRHIDSLLVFLASALLQEFDTWRFLLGLRYITDACGRLLLRILLRTQRILRYRGVPLILEHLLFIRVNPRRDVTVPKRNYPGKEDQQVERPQGTKKVSEKRRLYKRAYNKRLRASKRAARSGHEHTTDTQTSILSAAEVDYAM